MAYNIKHTAEQIDALLGEVFESTLQEKTIEITQSGTTEIVADEDFLALKKVNVNVNVQGGGGSGLKTRYFRVDSSQNTMLGLLITLLASLLRISKDGTTFACPVGYGADVLVSDDLSVVKAVGIVEGMYIGINNITIDDKAIVEAFGLSNEISKEEFFDDSFWK